MASLKGVLDRSSIVEDLRSILRNVLRREARRFTNPVADIINRRRRFPWCQVRKPPRKQHYWNRVVTCRACNAVKLNWYDRIVPIIPPAAIAIAETYP